jgi:hypothetical protein
MQYWLVATSGEKAVGGGIMKRQHPGQQMTNYIDVPSVDEFTPKIERLGGKVLVPKSPVPGMGYFAICANTEGNVFGIWKGDMGAK